MASGAIFNIQRYSTQDGPGIRTTVFFQGCPLDCLWCHNPEGISFKPVLTFQGERCIHCSACNATCPAGESLMPGDGRCVVCGACAGVCPAGARALVGRSMSADEVMDIIVRDRIFYDQSGGGVTFSGGEPLAQPKFLDELLERCNSEGVHTAIDTCGYAERSILIGLAKKTDLILYDLKGHDNARHLSHTGVKASPILENLNALADAHGSIWLRLPVVTGYTDDPREMELLAARYGSKKSIKRVVLLPYHQLGSGKLKKNGH